MPNGSPKHPRSAAEVQQEIERAREQITSSMVALRHEVAMRTDWRQWVRQHPGACLAGAFMVGFLLGNRR